MASTDAALFRTAGERAMEEAVGRHFGARGARRKFGRLTRQFTAVIPFGVCYQPLLHVVLYQPEIPQNTGNVGRTCLALGAKLWLVRPLGFRLDGQRLRRAGLDYWERLEWEVADTWPALEARLAEHRFWYFSKRAKRLYTSASFAAGDVLVFGSETQGLPPSLIDGSASDSLRIPTRSAVRSLNLASSAAVAAYEALRQLQLKRGELPQ